MPGIDVKISIVTIVRNAPDDLMRTILSVQDQSIQPFEHLIVDGLSNDSETIRIARDYLNEHPDYVQVFSERDQGISDALNKGARLSAGDYIICMNAGDEFYGSMSLEMIAEFVSSLATLSIVYAKPMIIYGEYDASAINVDYRNLDSIRHFWNPLCHQAMAVPKKIMLQHPFDVNLKYSMDLDCWLSAIDAGVRFEFADFFMCRYHAGGISSNPRNIPKLMIEHMKVYYGHGRLRKVLPGILNFLKFIIKFLAGPKLENIIKLVRLSR